MEERPLLFGLPEVRRRAVGRWLMLGMVAVMFVGIGLGFWPLFAASQRLPAFCESLTAGLSADAARSKAEASGYEVELTDDGRMLVKAPRMAAQVDSGRGCELRFGAQGLQSSAYKPEL